MASEQSQVAAKGRTKRRREACDSSEKDQGAQVEGEGAQKGGDGAEDGGEDDDDDEVQPNEEVVKLFEGKAEESEEVQVTLNPKP
jgi:hypothetical protein